MARTARLILPSAGRDQLLLFGVMLTIAIGNTGLQSVLPAMGRSLGVPDFVIGLAFSLSALIWTIAAPLWARRLGTHGAKPMVLTGMAGFAVSLLICAVALTAGVRGWIPAAFAFGAFILGRTIYGFFGAAAPPRRAGNGRRRKHARGAHQGADDA